MAVSVVLATGVALVQLGHRSERVALNPRACTSKIGEAAQGCHRAQTGARDVAAVVSGHIVFLAPADTREVTYTATPDGSSLLCALHTRLGVTRPGQPAWVKWTEAAS